MEMLIIRAVKTAAVWSVVLAGVYFLAMCIWVYFHREKKNVSEITVRDTWAFKKGCRITVCGVHYKVVGIKDGKVLTVVEI